MKIFSYYLVSFLLISCSSAIEKELPVDSTPSESPSDYTIVFASCNDQDRPQPLWKPIMENNPNLFIWGGDNVYADTDDMQKMKGDYDKVWGNQEYSRMAQKTIITGVWDDHDYGKNDAGVEWQKKEEAEKLFLDFLKVAEDDVRRTRPGTYKAETYTTNKGSIKVLLLDTRSFRDPLKKSEDPQRRYDYWPPGEGGTILGEDQWLWLTEELKDERPNFTLIVTSIQFLSYQHGWEKWGVFPDEVKKMEALLKQAKSKNIMMLSGDRHQAEISISNKLDLGYPLIDFTSSGLTHTWIKNGSSDNEYRVSNVVKQLNFGVLKFDFDTSKVEFEIRGANNFLFEQFTQPY